MKVQNSKITIEFSDGHLLPGTFNLLPILVALFFAVSAGADLGSRIGLPPPPCNLVHAQNSTHFSEFSHVGSIVWQPM